MGILNSIKDYFNIAQFTVSPTKKIKSISNDFKKAFNLTLVFYKGSLIAQGDLALAALNRKTAKDIVTKSKNELKIRASMKVGEVEKLFDIKFGVTVQIKDNKGISLIDNGLTLGNADRGN